MSEASRSSQGKSLSPTSGRKESYDYELETEETEIEEEEHVNSEGIEDLEPEAEPEDKDQEEEALLTKTKTLKDTFKTTPHINTDKENALNFMFSTNLTHNHPVTLTSFRNLQKKIDKISKTIQFFDNKADKDEYYNRLVKECQDQQNRLQKKYIKLHEQYNAIYKDVDIAKEGLFVNQPSFLMNYNQHIVEQRAFRSEGGLQECFDENGQLIYQSNPIKPMFMKPEETEFDGLDTYAISLSRTRPIISTYSSSTERPEYRLDIDVRQIKFRDHELMMEEEYLSRHLLDLFSGYEKRKKAALIEYYNSKVFALKELIQKFRNEYSNLSDDQVLETKNTLGVDLTKKQLLERKMHSTRLELKLNRTHLLEERAHQIAIVNNIIDTWNRMKEVRKNQGYMLTTHGVVFTLVNHDKEVDKQKLNIEIEECLQETKESIFFEYQQEMDEFQRRVLNEIEEFAEIPVKPDGPTFDEKMERKKIKKEITLGQRSPGNPELIPQLIKLTRIESQMPVTDEDRSVSFRDYRYYIKIYVGKNCVNRTKVKHLNRDFTVSFGEILPIYVYRWPEKIRLVIFRSLSYKRSKKMSSIFIQAPGAPGTNPESADLRKAITDNSSWDKDCLFSQEKSHTALWDQESIHNTTGEIQLKLAWFDKIPPYIIQTKGVNSKKFLADESHLPTAKDIFDLNNIKKWLKGNNIDPNDPKNTGLLSMLDLLENRLLNRDGFFLADQDDDLFIPGYNDIRYRKRLELIKERDDSYRLRKRRLHVSSYVREPPLPLLNLSIFSSIWSFFEARRPLKPSRRDRSMDVSRKIEEANIFIQIIRGHNLPIRSVHDDYNKYRGDMYMKKEKFLEGKLEEKANTGEFGIIHSVPLGEEELPEVKEDITTKDTIVSFVSCSFQGSRLKTKIVEGSFPQFNQTLVMPFKVPNDDYSTDVIKSVKDILYFDIFDEVTITNVKDDQYLHNLNQRSEFRWIGGFSIPFSTLYRAGKILGTFAVKTPPINMGYRYRDDQEHSTRLTVCITLDPPLPTPDSLVDSYSSSEIPALTSYVNWWTRIILNNPNCKKRIISVMEPNTFGVATLVCRYICPQEPPMRLMFDEDFQNEKENSEDEVPQLDRTLNIDTLPADKKNRLILKLARFVSLIPFVDDIVSFLERTDVWQTSEEFLSDGCGDHEEHANLLCNYFKYFKKTAWVMIGRAVPEGETAYVLTEETRDVETRPGKVVSEKYFLLWNPSTGNIYETTDPTCPVYEIGCVFDETNVWANIQKSGKPHRMSFDLMNRSHWQPLFRGNKSRGLLPEGIKTVQDPKLKYTYSDQRTVSDLEMDISMYVKEKFGQSRIELTKWSPHVEKELRPLLIELERYKQSNEIFPQKKQESMLKGITDIYNIIGFPLNFTYSNNETIIREILNTKIQEHQDENGLRSRYALGVYVHPYSNGIFSVWIYIAILKDKNSNNFGR